MLPLCGEIKITKNADYVGRAHAIKTQKKITTESSEGVGESEGPSWSLRRAGGGGTARVGAVVNRSTSTTNRLRSLVVVSV